MKYLLTISLLLSINIILSSQKLGEVSEQLLQQTEHPKDSSASAAYIIQNIEISYNFSGEKGTRIEMEYYYKIKVYHEDGESYGKFVLPFYKEGSNREKISSIKGVTSNYVNGEVVTTKLEKSDIYTEDTSENWKKTIFAMPEVRSGSVIEVKYKKTSPYIYSIPKWYFQHSIPTEESKYSIDVPSYFTLTPIPSGIHPISTESKPIQGSKHDEMNHTLSGKNIPAIKEDKYVLNIDDYRSSIKYELHSIQYPDGRNQKLSSNWKDIAIQLNESKYFGDQIDKKFKELNPIIEEANSLPSDEKLLFIYNHIRDNYTWNDRYGKNSYNGLSKFLKEKTGTSGDFNLLLQNMLQKCGIESYPLVMKSRSAGILNTYFPTLTELDYVIVYVPIEDGYLLLDASSKYSPMGELPTRAINLYGVIIKDGDAEIIEIENPNLFKVQTVSQYTYDTENNQLIGTSKRKRIGRASTKFKYDADNNKEENQETSDDSNDDDSQEDDIESFNLENTYEVTELKNYDDTYKPISLAYNEVLNTCSKKVGSNIFIDATLDFGLKKNPFEERVREFPVFFNSKIYSQTIASIEIPEGYTIESLPKSLNLTLPEKAAKFNYEANQMDNKIIIKYLFQVNKTVHASVAYEALKQLYDIMYDLSKEKLVLKEL